MVFRLFFATFVTKSRSKILKPSNNQIVMAIKIRLQQSKFKDANNGGKWHARTVNTGDVLTSDLANEIQATTTFTRG